MSFQRRGRGKKMAKGDGARAESTEAITEMEEKELGDPSIKAAPSLSRLLLLSPHPWKLASNPRRLNRSRAPTVEDGKRAVAVVAVGGGVEKGMSSAGVGLGTRLHYVARVTGGWWEKWMVMGTMGSKLEKALGD